MNIYIWYFHLMVKNHMSVWQSMMTGDVSNGKSIIIKIYLPLWWLSLLHRHKLRPTSGYTHAQKNQNGL